MAPVFYSFRRCPYAMRARLALRASGTEVALREVVLRDKPEAFLRASPSGTVPCLVLPEGGVIDESLDIMTWAMRQRDPLGWLDMPQAGHALIARCDGPFKHALDRTKYGTRYPGENPEHHRTQALGFLAALEDQLDGWLFGTETLADFAILPFVRQFAFIDKPRFDAEVGAQVRAWLDRFLNSDALAEIMLKYAQWHPGDAEVVFPTRAGTTIA